MYGQRDALCGKYMVNRLERAYARMYYAHTICNTQKSDAEPSLVFNFHFEVSGFFFNDSTSDIKLTSGLTSLFASLGIHLDTSYMHVCTAR